LPVTITAINGSLMQTEIRLNTVNN